MSDLVPFPDHVLEATSGLVQAATKSLRVDLSYGTAIVTAGRRQVTRESEVRLSNRDAA